jgi:hypothetical protein
MLLPFREHLDFGPTPYNLLQAKEGIPVVKEKVTDVLALALALWARMGVSGRVILIYQSATNGRLRLRDSA